MTQSLLPGSHWYCWERQALLCDDTETIPCKPGSSLQGDPQRAPGFLAFRPLVVPTHIVWVLVWITTECCARDGLYLSLVKTDAACCGCCPALSRGLLALGKALRCCREGPTCSVTEASGHEASEWIWKQTFQSWWSLQMTATSADIWAATSWETLSQNYTAKQLLYSSQKPCETINVCCFKPLSFGVMCYTAIDNQYSYWYICLPCFSYYLPMVYFQHSSQWSC